MLLLMHTLIKYCVREGKVFVKMLLTRTVNVLMQHFHTTICVPAHTEMGNTIKTE